jgi:hypothetical protein
MFDFSRLSMFCLTVVLTTTTGCRRADSTDAPRSSAVDVWTVEESSAGRIARLLTPRETTAEILVPGLPDAVRQVGEKLKQTATLDPQAYLLALRNAPEGKPPPYDVRLGISRDEYDLLLKGSQLQLQKKSEVRLTLRARENGRVVLLGLPDMAEIMFDPSTQSVTTPYGGITRASALDPAALQALVGPIAGFAWNEAAVGESINRFMIREILLGQTVGGGDAWLVVRILDTVQERMLVDYFVRFPGPAE